MGLAYQQKRPKAQDYSRKQLKTANSNSPWAYIREGLLSEGYLRLRFGGLIFGRAIFFFCGGGGGGGLTIGILQYVVTLFLCRSTGAIHSLQGRVCFSGKAI